MLYCLYLHRWMSHRFHLDAEQVPRRFQSVLTFRNNLRNYAFVMHSNELKLWLHFTNMFLAGGRFTDKGQTQDYERGFADITSLPYFAWSVTSIFTLFTLMRFKDEFSDGSARNRRFALFAAAQGTQ